MMGVGFNTRAVLKTLQQDAKYSERDVASAKDLQPLIGSYAQQRNALYQFTRKPVGWCNLLGWLKRRSYTKTLNIFDKAMEDLHRKQMLCAMVEPGNRGDKKRYPHLKHSVVVGYDHRAYALQSDPSRVLLGEGSYGKVRMAKGVRGEGDFAVKKIPLLQDPSHRRAGIRNERHRQEVKIHASLSSQDHFFRGRDAIVSSGSNGLQKCYIFMPLADGDLSSLIPKIHHPFFDVTTKNELLSCLCVSVVKAVADLHRQGIYHRDIKPDNFLWNIQGAVGITDFGFATREKKGDSTCGTPDYMAPERQDKSIPLHDRECLDLWSLGIVLYQITAGFLPKINTSEGLDEYLSDNVYMEEHRGFSQVLRGLLNVDYPSSRMPAQQACQLLLDEHQRKYGAASFTQARVAELLQLLR